MRLRALVVTTVALFAVGTAGCGFVLATPPKNTTIPRGPEFAPNNPLPKLTPEDEVLLTIPTTTALPNTGRIIPPEPSLEYWESVKGNSILTACDELDRFAIGGARIGAAGSTPTSRNPTLTRAEQAEAITELRTLAGSLDRFDDLLAESGTPLDDQVAFDQAVADLRQLASVEPADGDARDTLTEWLDRHDATILDMQRKTVELCPLGMLAQMLAYRSPS